MKTKEAIEITADLKYYIVFCNEAEQLLFKRMYSPKDLELPINDVIDNMPIEKIKWALSQVETTLKKKIVEPGILKGELCSRNSCLGIIDEHESDSCCSCHINPPCSYCTTSREYCPACGWDAYDDKAKKNEQALKNSYQGFGSKEMHDSYYVEKEKRDKFNREFELMYNGEISSDKTIIISESHTHFSMIKRGVFAKGTETRKSLLDNHRVSGTFGGRFEHINDYSFKYIAYTD